MVALAQIPVRMSVEEFLNWESADGLRYELVDGEPRAMAPAGAVHGFLQNQLGRLIGNRTWGGTIATWPRHQLVDGTVTTQPEFCYYFREVGDSLENHGVEADIDVQVAPQHWQPGEDRQLAAAVQHLLGGLSRDEGRPGVAGQQQLALGRAAAKPQLKQQARVRTR